MGMKKGQKINKEILQKREILKKFINNYPKYDDKVNKEIKAGVKTLRKIKKKVFGFSDDFFEYKTLFMANLKFLSKKKFERADYIDDKGCKVEIKNKGIQIEIIHIGNKFDLVYRFFLEIGG